MHPLLKSIKAVSEEIRIRILLLLIDREACVCELMKVFNMAQSKLSHHLIALHKAGLLSVEKRGKWHYYSVKSKMNNYNSGLIKLLRKSLDQSEVIKNDRLKMAKVSKNMRRKIARNNITGVCPECKILKK